MSDAPAILCIGRLYCDLIFTDLPRPPRMGTEVYAGGLGTHAGGGAFITAAHLAALGQRAALAATLPAAPFGDIVMAEVARAGVDARHCTPPTPGAEPQITVALTGDGDRAFVTRRTGPAYGSLSSRDLAALGVGHVHVGEMATLIERPDIADLARAAGATLSLDCSWDESLRAPQIAAALANIDLFLPNADEVRHLEALGVALPADVLTVIKQGADGAEARGPAGRVHAPARPVTVVDTTGAGDAFNAGFIAAWRVGRPLAECLAQGNAQGARAIGKRGGFHTGCIPAAHPQAVTAGAAP